jgi:hypothetical protein
MTNILRYGQRMKLGQLDNQIMTLLDAIQVAHKTGQDCLVMELKLDELKELRKQFIAESRDG